MKKYLNNIVVILCIVLCVSFTPKQDCKLLPNGAYRVQFLSNRMDEFEIIIQDSTFIRHPKNNVSFKGKIKRIYNCVLIFDYPNIYDATAGNPLLKKIRDSFGEECYELKEGVGDTIKFRTTYTANLHITTNEGMFIKIPKRYN